MDYVARVEMADRKAPRLRGEANREDVVRRVIAATERLLAYNESFMEIQIARIASEAGMARSTFYMHFRDRAELVQEIMSLLLDDFEQEIAKVGQMGANPSPEKLRALIGDLVEVFHKHETLVIPLYAVVQQDSKLRLRYEVRIAFIAAAFEMLILAQPVERRRLGRPLDIARVIARLIEGTITREMPGANAERRARLAHTIADICWSAMFLDHPSAETNGVQTP